jgi:hypothetical protein
MPYMLPHLWVGAASNVAATISKGRGDGSKSLKGGGSSREYYGSSFNNGCSSTMKRLKSLYANGDN